MKNTPNIQDYQGENGREEPDFDECRCPVFTLRQRLNGKMPFNKIKFQIVSNFGRATGIYARMAYKMMCVKKIGLLILLAATTTLQVTAQQQLIKAELLRKHQILRSQRLARVNAINGRIPVHLPFVNESLLVDVTPGGVPIYKSPINSNASITTGVVKLQSGMMGLNLQGSGIVVGVWDAGKVDQHAELDTRVLFRESASLSQHAIHVTGTILATGLNATAKGMAPSAKAITHYFNDDYDEMTDAVSAEDPLIISNHSYGSLTGWYRSAGVWHWTGDADISDKEDYRFGLYAHDAEEIDLIANLAPYYTMVWAAGNDRWEVGDGTFPADGNQGTGYDCIIPEGVAKNNITIGAVDKVLSYADASSVPMAFFSSWGPTDDGRIKPDLVADGVNVFSLSTGGNYTILSGTSMATPNVTGSLMLLQELHKKLHSNQIMRSATLKALAIHTAKESGSAAGPDYRFGWGLMDAEGAANVLLREDGLNVRVDELSLANNQSYAIELEPVANKKITATIAWTDPAATSPGHQLDPQTLMLVNDLDIRIADLDGNEIFPWILDPANPPGAATRGDNFRDNVEKIEFELPEDKIYQLIVTHKGSLVNPQNFSLILTHESKQSTAKTFYWIGGNGNWSDGTQWSHASGGAAANAIPTSDDRVTIDENSFSGSGEETITLDVSGACKTFTWLTERAGVLSMNGNRLKVSAEMVLSSDYFRTATGGTFEFSGGGALLLQKGDLSQDTLLFSSGTWEIKGALNAARVRVEGALLKLPSTPVTIQQLIADDEALIDFNKTQVEGIELLILDNTQLETEASSFVVSNEAVFGWTSIDYHGSLIVGSDGMVSLYGDNVLDSVVVDGSISLLGANEINYLEGNPGAIISMVEGRAQQINELDLMGNDDELIEIRSMTNSNATIAYDKHEKLCFDYLKVVDIDIESESVFNAGEHSELLDSEDWSAVACDDALFADFIATFTCVDGITFFVDQSTGPVAAWEWDFGDGSPLRTSDSPYAPHQYTAPGNYTVTLTVGAGVAFDTYQRQIEILPSGLSNSVVQNGFVLTSQQSADAYQWYFNTEPISDATNKTFVFDEPGSYQVLITNDACNHLSEPFIILSSEEEAQRAFTVYPNPVSDRLTIHFKDSGITHRVTMSNAVGQPMTAQHSRGEDIELNMEKFAAGMYVVDVDGHRQKVIVRR